MIEQLHYYMTDCTDPYENLALEEWLMLHTAPGQCILYLWQNARTVVIGRNQNAWSECRIAALEADGGHLARRLSGGGAVYHDMGNLNFTFLVHKPDYDIDRQLSVIEDAVRSYGLPAMKTGRNDVTIDGRKFSGNAFYRMGVYCYHHGTLLVDTDGEAMSRYLNVSKAKLASKGVASVRSRVVNLRELLPDLTIPDLQQKLLASFAGIYGGIPVPLPDAMIDWDAIRARAAEFAERSWLLGSNTAFSDRADGRFPWGGLTIEYTVQGGILRQVQLYSDGMDAEFLLSLPALLEGCLFTPAALEALTDRLPDGDPLHHTMLRDAIGLLCTQIE
ncbi:MAG: lipoate--protein ligase [Clostridia bacterium]|nr:lipoate--protein ligase [Clostridia bacterium]